MKQKLRHLHLTSKADLGSLTLKNRMILAAMGSNFSTLDGHCSEKLIAYYEARARGGAAMLILETSAITWPAGASMPNTIGFSSDQFLPGLTELAARVHQHDCKITAQLNHSGKIAQEDTIAGRPLLVPSMPDKASSDLMPLLTQAEISTFIKAAGPDGRGPRYQVMSEADIQQLVSQFAEAAVRAKTAGFDAVEIHGGHGYVISSFLSPASNRRTDSYGGTLDNRARLLVEVIKAIRGATGKSFTILVRLDAMEYRIEGGTRPADFCQVARIAEQAGADAIDVSAYGNIGKSIAFTEAPLVHEPGGFLAFARMAKQTVNIPIIAVGRIELDAAEQGLAAGDFDFVAMGRKLLADPELPNKVIAGEIKAIRPCIYCYVCVSKIFINQPTCCAVNPEVGFEYRKELIPTHNLTRDPTSTDTPTRQHMLVIGGGPGGMEAARLLSLQGHKVSLWERDRDLGGTARIAALAYEPNGRLIDYLVHNLQVHKVDVHLNRTATPTSVLALRPDHVFVATGAARQAPDIIGKDLDHVFDGEQMRGLLFGSDPQAIKKLRLDQQLMLTIGRHLQLLRNVRLMRLLSRLWMPISRRIVIIGGGLVGLEMAEFLLERGRHITVLEPSATLAPELSIVRRARVIHLLREHGATLITNVNIQEINKSGVNYLLDEQLAHARAGQVIIAMGAQPEMSLAGQLLDAGLPVTAIGDCQAIGYIEGAMESARSAVIAVTARTTETST